MAERRQDSSQSRRRVKSRPEGLEGQKRRLRPWMIVVIGFVVVALGGSLAFLLASGSTEARPISAIQASDYHALVFSPEDPNTVFFGHHNGLLKSADGGRTWQPAKSQANWDAMGLAIPISTPKTFYAAGHNIFYKSADGGRTWQEVKHNLPGTDIHGFAADPDDPQVLYAYVVGGGLFRSQDGGSVWGKVTDRLPQSTHALTVLPGTPKTLLTGNMESGLSRSENGGATWSRVTGGFTGNMVMGALAAAPQTPGLVYAGSEAGIFRSNDGGLTWRPSGLNRQAMALAVSPQNDNLLLVVDSEGQVYRSKDGGATWGGKG